MSNICDHDIKWFPFNYFSDRLYQLMFQNISRDIASRYSFGLLDIKDLPEWCLIRYYEVYALNRSIQSENVKKILTSKSTGRTLS